MSKKIYLVEIESAEDTRWLFDEAAFLSDAEEVLTDFAKVHTKGTRPRVTVSGAVPVSGEEMIFCRSK